MNKLITILLLLILLFVILIIHSYYTNREKYNNNKDFKILMFLTGGLKEEAENCIKSLKNQKLDDKLVVTTLDDEAYNHISKLGVKPEKRKTNLKNEAKFGTKDFYEITINKLDIIRESIEKHNKIVVYTDTDIVFLKDISGDVIKFNNSNHDFMFQNDTTGFNEKEKSNMCTGFIMCKPNKNCINVLKATKQIMLDNWNKRGKGKLADQGAMRIAIKENI